MKKIIVKAFVLTSIVGCCLFLFVLNLRTPSTKHSPPTPSKTPSQQASTPPPQAVPTQPTKALTKIEPKRINRPSVAQPSSTVSSTPQTTEQQSTPPPSYPETPTGTDTFEADGTKYPNNTFTALSLPNDPLANQWWVADTNLDVVWAKSTGSTSTIAIIDTGFALNHQEFAGRWADNAGEVGPTSQESATLPNCTSRGLALDKSCNAIDDDSNDYIDDWRGWDFTNDDNSVQAGETNPTSSVAFHGSSVAGIAAANANNGTGIAGVSWGAKILPVQALTDDGAGDTLSVSRAIRYAADRGANVINLSLGSSAPDSYIRQAIQYALQHGSLVVAAAGNDGCNCLSYPAAYPEVVAVGAYDSNGSRSSFSSYGANLDLMAPGSGMTAPSWTNGNGTSGYASGIAGTSFASPYISGLLANAHAARPTASWGELVGLLKQQADHRTMTSSAPRSDPIGFGYVKAGSFISRITDTFSTDNRYILATATPDALGSAYAYDCQSTTYPSLPLYEVIQGGQIWYTVSDLSVALASASGATVNQKAYVCASIAQDSGTIINRINSAAEFSNYSGKAR